MGIKKKNLPGLQVFFNQVRISAIVPGKTIAWEDLLMRCKGELLILNIIIKLSNVRFYLSGVAYLRINVKWEGKFRQFFDQKSA
jgi:hypothetical protein